MSPFRWHASRTKPVWLLHVILSVGWAAVVVGQTQASSPDGGSFSAGSLLTEYLKELRGLEGVDEDDDEYDQAAQKYTHWHHLGNYVDPDSVTYDMVQGFFFVAVVGCILWCVWGCGVRLGFFHPVLLRHGSRLQRDGRGVFTKVPNHLFEDNDAWDDDTQISMEFGHSHLDDEYGEIDMREEERMLNEEADDFFGESDDRMIRRIPPAQETNEDDEQGKPFVDLEMTPSKPTATKETKTTFI